MKLSTESIVAAVVAVVFGILSLAAVAREQSLQVTGGSNGSSHTAVLGQISLHASSNSLSVVRNADSEVLGVY
jgi:hypothetical protein